VALCEEIAADRKSHIEALESTGNNFFFDDMNEFRTHVLESQGKAQSPSLDKLMMLSSARKSHSNVYNFLFLAFKDT